MRLNIEKEFPDYGDNIDYRKINMFFLNDNLKKYCIQ